MESYAYYENIPLMALPPKHDVDSDFKRNSTSKLINFFPWSDEEIRNYLEDYVCKDKIENIYGTREVSSGGGTIVSLIQWCCKKGFEKSLDFMVEHNVDMHQILPGNSKHPLLYLLQNGRLLRKYLIEKKVFDPPDKIPKEILAKAITKRKCKPIELFATILDYLESIKSHKNICKEIVLGTDKNGRTALHYAALFSYEQCFSKLIEKGSSLTLTDNDNKTPIDLLQDPNLLVNHLNSCIEVTNPEIKDKAYQITINYETLMKKSSTDTVDEVFFLRALKDKKFKNCLSHPVVDIFISIKREKLRNIFYLYVLLNLGVCLTNYAGTAFYDSKNSNSAAFIFFVALILSIILGLMELAVFGLKSLKKIQFIETCLLIVSLFLYLGLIEKYPKSNTILVCLSSITFLTTYKLFFILILVPSWSLHIMLFRRTTRNFFKLILLYLLPFLAFSLCFHLLNEEKSKTFLLSVFETIILFTGNISEDDLSKFHSNPVFSHIVVVLFIFIIVIILNNLLIALAINDLEQIYNDASYIGSKEIASYLIIFENLFWKKKNDCTKYGTKFVCSLADPKLFKEKCTITIHPKNNRKVQIGDNQREHIDITNAIKSLQNFVSTDIISQNKEKASIENKLLTEIEEMKKELKSIKDLLVVSKS